MIDTETVRRLIVRLLIVTVTLLCGMSFSAWAQTSSALKFQSAVGLQHTAFLDKFSDSVSKLTDADLKIAIDGKHLSVQETIEAVEKQIVVGGIAPLRAILKPRTSGDQLAYDAIPGIALGHTAAIEVDRRFRRGLPDFIRPDLELLFTYPGNARGLYVRDEIKSLNDLKGVRFAAFNAATASFAKALDADLIARNSKEFRDAVRGDADAFLATPQFATNDAMRDSRVRYFYPLRVLYSVYGVFINRQIFKQLTARDQEALLVAAALVEKDAWKDQARREQSALARIEERGLKMARGMYQIKLDLRALVDTSVKQLGSTLHRLVSDTRYDELPSRLCRAVSIFFGTNRAVEDQSDPDKVIFGAEAGPLQFGRVDLAVPYRDQHVDLPRHLQCAHEPVEDVTVLRRALLSRADFAREIKNAAAQKPAPTKAILVHGYGNDFDDAAALASQFTYDTDRKSRHGFMFSWPSQGRPYPWDYYQDQGAVKTAPEPLAETIQTISDALSHDIDLIAHSMGSRALAGAIKELKKRQGRPVRNQLNFIAADIAVRSFEKIVSSIRTEADRALTLYMSDNDVALRLSKLIHPTNPRVGLISGLPFVLPPFDPVDVSNQNRSFLGHSYLRVEPIVRYDVEKARRTRKRAIDRGLKTGGRFGVQVYIFK